MKLLELSYKIKLWIATVLHFPFYFRKKDVKTDQSSERDRQKLKSVCFEGELILR